MITWQYKRIDRELDMSSYDTPEDYMMLGPGIGPTYQWTDLSFEESSSKHTGELPRLQILGQDGWELVSVLHEHVGRKYTFTYYLKRAL